MSEPPKEGTITESFPEMSEYINDGKNMVLTLLAHHGLLTDAESELWGKECKLQLVFIGDPKEQNLALVCQPPEKYRGH